MSTAQISLAEGEMQWKQNRLARVMMWGKNKWGGESGGRGGGENWERERGGGGVHTKIKYK